MWCLIFGNVRRAAEEAGASFRAGVELAVELSADASEPALCSREILKRAPKDPELPRVLAVVTTALTAKCSLLRITVNHSGWS